MNWHDVDNVVPGDFLDIYVYNGTKLVISSTKEGGICYMQVSRDCVEFVKFVTGVDDMSGVMISR